VRDYKAMSDTDVLTGTRNREALARYTWSPYMHNPKLKNRLHRINIPTLFLWGTKDRIVTPDYGRAYSTLVPGARFELVEAAGHLPHVEQPDVFAKKILGFVDSARAAAPLVGAHT